MTGVVAGFGTMHDPFLHIGLRHGWGQLVPFDLHSPTDRRRHVYIIGKTGSGKTTLLRNLIIQHIVAGDGVGVRNGPQNSDQQLS